MSYRDLRNFTEMMRALGYTRLISMENFRNPNFPLVAEILLWLTQRFDPDADISPDIETETDRVVLIRSVVQFMALKVNVMMNTKRLYQADGYAVREMLKATTLLFESLLNNYASQNEQNERLYSAMNTVNEISSKVHDLKRIRQLASEITRKGAKLYDLLGNEVDLRELRNWRLNRQLEINEVERGLQDAIESVRSEIVNTKQLIENVSVSEATLDGKIEKRRSELDRNRKRLQTLQKVRPAFIEEFERLELELKQLYEEYIVMFRCVTYLEQQQESAELSEQERMEERQAATRKLLEQFKAEEGSLKLLDNPIHGNQIGLIGTPGPGDPDDVAKFTAAKRSAQNDRSTLRAAAGSRPMTGRRGQQQQNPPGAGAPGHRNPRVYGSMTGSGKGGGGDSVSLDSDSDLLLDGSELLASDDDDEDELELDPDATGAIRAPTGRPPPSRKPATGERGGDASDDDF